VRRSSLSSSGWRPSSSSRSGAAELGGVAARARRGGAGARRGGGARQAALVGTARGGVDGWGSDLQATAGNHVVDGGEIRWGPRPFAPIWVI
jgi:hypothetical protein